MGRNTINRKVEVGKLRVSSTADSLVIKLGSDTINIGFLDTVTLRNYLTDFTNDYRIRHRDSLLGMENAAAK